MYKYNKDELKNSLELTQVYDLVMELGGEPILQSNYFISRTICHNPAGCGSHKLYYYDNTKLFKCYTDCDGYFDLYELVRKQKTISDGVEWSLPKAIAFVAFHFGYSSQTFDFEDGQSIADWGILNNYERLNNLDEKEQTIELKVFDDSILKYLPRPRITIWEQEGINKNIIDKRGIAYDPINEGIIIPHYDINNNLIGIRIRTLIKEQEKRGKYMPAKLNNRMYNHSLSFNLYNLNNSKEAIKTLKKAIIFEGEKSCLLYASYFGEDSDISVACCGSSLISYQVKLLLSLGVQEIIIAFDKQFIETGDEEWKRWTKKLKEIYNKYGAYVQISFMFDKWNLLKYKSSPIDDSKDTFIELFNRRIIL